MVGDHRRDGGVVSIVVWRRAECRDIDVQSTHQGNRTLATDPVELLARSRMHRDIRISSTDYSSLIGAEYSTGWDCVKVRG